MSLTSNIFIVLVFVTVNVSFCDVDLGIITNQRMNPPDFVKAVIFLLFQRNIHKLHGFGRFCLQIQLFEAFL